MNDVTSDTVRFRFPAVRRLKLSCEFERVRKGGRAVRGGPAHAQRVACGW